MDSANFPQICAQFGGQYALYCQAEGRPAFFQANAEVFSSASVIKIPILLAWAALEERGEVDLAHLCDLSGEPAVGGAGIARWMTTRPLTYHDVLLLMMATSDNWCTNLAIRRVGLARLNDLFRHHLGLQQTVLQRKLMDYEARARGLDNLISAQDCITLFERVHSLPERQKDWVEPMLLACQDSSLLLRDLPRDGVHFYHKTGSIPGVLHDWGYTRACDLFLLTQHNPDEIHASHLFGQVGRGLACVEG